MPKRQTSRPATDRDPVRPVAFGAFARITGVERSTVGRGARGAMKAACLPGKRLDVAHPAVQRWLSLRGLEPSIFDVVVAADGEPEQEVLAGSANDIDLNQVDELTLQEITDRWGSDERFHSWVKARKELATAQHREVQLARLEGQLIPRTLVQVLVATVDATFSRALTDTTQSLAARLAGVVHTREEAMAMIRDRLGRDFRRCIRELKRRLERDNPRAPLHDPAPNTSTARGRPSAALAPLRTALLGDAAGQIVAVVRADSRQTNDVADTIRTILRSHFDRVALELDEGPLDEDQEESAPR